MNNSTKEEKLKRIERASNVLRGVSHALFVPVVIIGLAAITSILAGWSAHIDYQGQSYVPSAMALQPRVILAVVVVLTAAVLLKALHHLRLLANNYSRREIFTAESARQVCQVGISCVLWGVVKVVWTFLPLALSTNRPPVYNASTDSILMGVIIIGLSWFAEMAAALREENDLTI
jgi:hypothetical protein